VGKYCCHDTSDVLIEPKQNELCGEKFRFDMCEEDMSATFKPMQHCKTC
jgi:hypothetical protein